MMTNTFKLIAASTLAALAFGAVSASAAQATPAVAPTRVAVNKQTNEVKPLPHVVAIESGHFSYKFTQGVGIQTLSGISPLMLIVPDGKTHHSDIKVTMSDGTELYRFKDNFFVNVAQVKG